MDTVAVVGLGYVGLPLAIAFGSKITTIGFDLDTNKLKNYRQAKDPSREIEETEFQAASKLEFTNDPSSLARANYIIVAVPTPIDVAHQPDLTALRAACQSIGPNLSPGTIIIFESTVYPGCTEEVCVPILEATSNLPWLGREPEPSSRKSGFNIGYSPERINPGDKAHRLETITKVVAGDTEETLEKISRLYGTVVLAGVHRAPSIKVAEAAKVIENTQRDLNIALMNELSLIFHKLGVDTLDVLEAAGTKWNFLPFRPGLVGGHCIGVDPYYLTYRAEAAGHHPQVILAGRQTNDSMGKYIAEQTIKQLTRQGHSIKGSKIAILGLTFKENCPDLRNSKVIDIIKELQEYGCEVLVHDPIACSNDAQREYGIALSEWSNLKGAQALVLAVSHQFYKQVTPPDILELNSKGMVLIDVKSNLDRALFKDERFKIWRL